MSQQWEEKGYQQKYCRQ